MSCSTSASGRSSAGPIRPFPTSTRSRRCAAIARIPDRLADRHFVSQSFWLDRICRARLDYVGHLESLAVDWPAVGRRIGREVALPQLNSSAAIAFSPPIPDVIKERYAADFERFSYSR